MNSTVYIHGNGEVLCSEHLGVTAKATGYDLDGYKIMPADSNEIGIKCEVCEHGR